MLKSAEYWIENLYLEPHPEGGWFRETYRSSEKISESGLPLGFSGNRNFSTAIYYLLQNDDFSAWHRIKSDEMWHYYDGDGAIEIHTLSKIKGHEIRVLGSNPENGGSPQVVVPANTWFASRLTKQKMYALAGCTVAPGFDFDDFEMGEELSLVKEFPQHVGIIKEFIKK
ncbi:MAG: cupin domain-containing protein [Bacteroidales bacterium]|nr:cupin domain-containing protein [Bacteroidales bacterium]MCF8458340.1 cupin domain-containing protein [Bacteroidales bacterium]